MEKDIECMKEFIEEELRKERKSSIIDSIKEVLDILKPMAIEEELKLDSLLELYRFTKLCETPIAIDPRGDYTVKIDSLNVIKSALTNNEFTKESIVLLKKVNEELLDNYLNPLNHRKALDNFYEKNPGARF